MNSLSQSHYDKPVSHTQNQTRWVIGRNKKVFSPSIKVMDITVNPNKPSYFPALTGVYAIIKRLQISLGGKIVDKWDAQSVLPYQMAESGESESQKGIFSILYLTGNNVIYDAKTEQLTLNRPLVDSRTASIKLNVYSDLLNNIGVINEDLEIIVDWEPNIAKYLCPVDVAATKVNIAAPTLTYETFNDDIPQPAKVSFKQMIEDRMVIPEVTASTLQQIELRSNAFNQKYISRFLMSNIPFTINSCTPSEDAATLFSVFGPFMSIPMIQENINVAKNGQNILTMRNINNDSIKLAITHETWGQGCLVSGAHYHSKTPVLQELDTEFGTNLQSLNGFASFGSVEVNDYIAKDLQFSYRRVGGSGDYSTLREAMIFAVAGQVECLLVGNKVQYIL